MSYVFLLTQTYNIYITAKKKRKINSKLLHKYNFSKRKNTVPYNTKYK